MTLKTILACILAAGIAMSAAAQDLKPVKDKQTKKYGYQTKDKRWVVEPVFDNAKRFVDGYAEVTLDGRVGLIDANCDWVFPAEYDDIGSFHKNGLCELMRKEGRTKLRGVGDRSGRIVIPVDCRSVNIPRKEGLITAQRPARGELEGELAWGVYDQDGREIFAPQFASAPSFRDGVGIVKSVANGLEGVINERGGVVLPFNYLSVGHFGTEYMTLDLNFTQTLWDEGLRKMRAARLPGAVVPYDPQGDAVRAAAWHDGCIGRRMYRNMVKLLETTHLTGSARCSDLRSINWGRGRFLRLEPVPAEPGEKTMKDPVTGKTYLLKAFLYEADGTLVGEASSYGSIAAVCDEGAIYYAEENELWLLLSDVNTTAQPRFTVLLDAYKEVGDRSILDNLSLTADDIFKYSVPRAYAERVIEIAKGENIGISSYTEPDLAYLRSPAARDLMRAPLFRYPYRMGEVLNCSVHVRSEGIEVDLYENLICRFEDRIETPYYRMSGEEEIFWGPNNARTVRLSVEPAADSALGIEDDITGSRIRYQIVLSLYEEDGSWLRTLARADYADYIQDGVIVFERLGIAVVAPEVLRRPERIGRYAAWGYSRGGRDARGEVIRTVRLPQAQRLPRTLSALEQAAKGSFAEHRFSGRRGWY